MALSKRNRVKAEFNMSSLTDIIFLLLIFFMLTSSLVIPNALNLQLPSSSSTTLSSAQVERIQILNNGSIRYNNTPVDMDKLSLQLKQLSARKGKEATVTIAPGKSTPTYYVIQVMEEARINNINAILDTPDR